MKALDFFCGAGGLTRGLLDAGIDVVGGIDIDGRLRQTYESNNAPSRFYCEDVENLNVRLLRRESGITDDDIVVYTACCPCQPFSSLNRNKDGDGRRNLLLAVADIVAVSPPDFVLVENVPGLNTAYGRDIYNRFTESLIASGFVTRFEQQLDAKEFGVPQTRKRWILAASRHGDFTPPRKAVQTITVREAIEDYPKIADGVECLEVPNHAARKLQDNHLRIVEAVPIDGGNRRDVLDQEILLACHRNNPNVHKDVFGRMTWDAPAPTLTGRCTDVYCGRFVHPEQHRGISLREAAALQTFRDDYVFHGSFFHMAHQIGNAVPVEFARRLGDALWENAVRQGLLTTPIPSDRIESGGDRLAVAASCLPR